MNSIKVYHTHVSAERIWEICWILRELKIKLPDFLDMKSRRNFIKNRMSSCKEYDNWTDIEPPPAPKRFNKTRIFRS